MGKNHNPIYSGQTRLNQGNHKVSGEFIDFLDEKFYKIGNYDHLQPFFMSLVSSTNHWLFISSTGGLSAGRVNPEQALFPYYTEDKITENSENTGSKSIFLVQRGDVIWLWEPFSIRQQGQYSISRNLYKNIDNTALVFEEENHHLGLIYRYAWRTGDRFGFIKSSWLINTAESCHVLLLDGIQNILPAYATQQIQNTTSCLLDAYKRSELDVESGLGIFALNATLTDLPEPSESLMATTVFQVGLNNPQILLSSTNLDKFRSGHKMNTELEVRGKRAAYFAQAELEMLPNQAASWHIVADVSQDGAQIAGLKRRLLECASDLEDEINADIRENTTSLKQIVAQADGLQLTADLRSTTHHFANVMFNTMRGGLFYDQYWIDKKNFTDYIVWHNKSLLQEQNAFFSALPERVHVSDLHSRAEQNGNADLIRLSYCYLPLFFSRRHGDPSRPWNQFSINIKNPDGSGRLDYQGNWRDIFQNWEALAWSYPEFTEGMIATFLSATTLDGYNPYRISLEGIDWEAPDPGNPWSNIGYWSDHQIIYLLKLMELSVKVHPGKLAEQLDQLVYSFANVPYRIKPFDELLKDPYNTITFDGTLDARIEAAVKASGTDRKLVCDASGKVVHRSLMEKLINLLLAKLVNFVPEGGIWMNTQRPEWNDANNALVGKGLSVVTLGYLYRYINFLIDLLKHQPTSSFHTSIELADLFSALTTIFEKYQDRLQKRFKDQDRYDMLSELGKAGSQYRTRMYNSGFSGEHFAIPGLELQEFLELIKRYLAHTLSANRRDDNLFHSYNVIQFAERRLGIKHLDLMLEGQVSILSSGLLTGTEALAVLRGLESSTLFTPEQQSYILYPDKILPSFLEKNIIPPKEIQELQLPKLLVANNDRSLFVKDELGAFHFSGTIHNEKDVRKILEKLRQDPEYQPWVEKEAARIAELFELVFKHSEFTGRSSTFFAYEGLGSVYWHMVSKLLLAVEENIFTCNNANLTAKLIEKYREIRAGLGFNKTPEQFNGFPSDPYSHTPKGQGARQPGMTGTVKEEIITRLKELTLTVEDGCLVFDPILFDRTELLSSPASFSYLAVDGTFRTIEIPVASAAYTYCQTPIILQLGEETKISIFTTDHKATEYSGNKLDKAASEHVFLRDGLIEKILVQLCLDV